MEIKTKYSLKDVVYFMHRNKICSGDISVVYANVSSSHQEYEYLVRIPTPNEYEHTNFREGLLFSTKEELMKTL